MIAPGILPSIGEIIRALLPNAQKAAVITDDNVKELYLKPVMRSLEGIGLSAISLSIPPGEESKTGGRYLSLLGLLSENRLTRTDPIIALGGGVVGDLAGFAAATYLRGAPFIQVPTTLLAMADSSVGGKTGIDLPAGKNLAGTFYQPTLVLCDTDTLHTLPQAIFRAGCAEVIKYGMLCSPQLLGQLRCDSIKDRMEEVIAECVAIKRDIVQRDEFDRAERMLLNFGHTVGHSIEKLSGYEIPHGFAVAIGMAVDTRAAVRKKLCPPDCLEILESLLARYQLPNRTEYSSGNIYQAALHDKKRAGDQITIVVPRALGGCELEKIPATDLLSWIEMGLNP